VEKKRRNVSRYGSRKLSQVSERRRSDEFAGTQREIGHPRHERQDSDKHKDNPEFFTEFHRYTP
jgi:hypothetical protein